MQEKNNEENYCNYWDLKGELVNTRYKTLTFLNKKSKDIIEILEEINNNLDLFYKNIETIIDIEENNIF